LTTADLTPPEPLAQLRHCLRAKPATVVTEVERAAFLGYCSKLTPSKLQSALYRLWDYWESELRKNRCMPTMTAWLAREGGSR
jgi:hypothetical protein